MFEYLRNVEGNSNPVMMFVKATGTAADQPVAGDAVALAAGLAVKADAADTAILGIAKEGVNDDGEVLVIVDPRATYRVAFTGTTKTTLAQADMFALFDLSDEVTIDLDASTTDVFQILGYDNTAETAVVKINKPVIL